MSVASTEMVPGKQRAITRAGSRLLKRHGVRRVTVEEICREAQVSKATFYKYFPNKIELVKHILERMAHAGHRRLAEIEALDRPFPERVRLVIGERLEGVGEASEAFLDDWYHASEELAACVVALRAQTHELVLDFVRRAQARGEMRPGVRPEFVLALLEKLDELAADDALRGRYGDPVALTKDIVDFFFHGLLTDEAAPNDDGR